MNALSIYPTNVMTLTEVRQQQVQEVTQSCDFAFIPGHILREHLSFGSEFATLAAQWDDLPVDEYSVSMRCQRYRRFGRFLFDPLSGRLSVCPARPFVQAKTYNALYGGVERRFVPLLPGTSNSPLLHELIRFDFEHLPVSDKEKISVWEIGVHQIAIRPMESSPGNATPEGIHQDGHDFVAMHLFKRENVTGGVSRLFDLKQQPIGEVVLTDTLDTLIIKDVALFHEVSLIAQKELGRMASRNMLLLDFNCLARQ